VTKRPIHIAYSLGTRPEVIRSVRLLQLMADDPHVRLTLINSGQHYDLNMLGDFLTELEVPEVSAQLGVGSGDPATQTGSVLTATGRVLRQHNPEALCVFGDTNSTLGAALAAVKLGIPLIHIESGCRSYDMQMPEEVNRRLVDQMAGLLLAVSELGRENLVKESVHGRIEVVGDPLFDVFHAQAPRGRSWDSSPQGLVTLHRPDNVDDEARFAAIIGELDTASQTTGMEWAFPVHPRTRKTLPADMPSRVHVTDPVSYKELLELLATSLVCVTDSGGLQKEALWMRVPCVTVRKTTEWMETVWQGANILAPLGTDLAGAIVRSLKPEEQPDFSNPYGDGNASERILTITKDWIVSQRTAPLFGS
jgi:UDP-N-acetylglucosamine 2-epimerase